MKPFPKAIFLAARASVSAAFGGQQNGIVPAHILHRRSFSGRWP
jgi:hypothetical protein